MHYLILALLLTGCAWGQEPTVKVAETRGDVWVHDDEWRPPWHHEIAALESRIAELEREVETMRLITHIGGPDGNAHIGGGVRGCALCERFDATHSTPPTTATTEQAHPR